MSQAQPVYVRLTPEEREMLERLVNYLHKHRKIESPTLSDALRVCLYFTVGEIIKAVEAERYK